ncbi:MAG: DUF1643 domain-containing protein [Bacteroidia bacterium]|nr:DUF1643 domain-containing protein [Bacteroidia bacterium]
MCIGLNPNTANENTLDGTSRNFQRIANDNGFDGWCLVDLYPTRNPKAGNLNDIVNDKLFQENIEQIDTIVCSEELKITDVLIGWGDDINEKGYFKYSIYGIYQRLKKHNLKFHTFRINKSGNPSHPSPMTINTRYKLNEKIKMTEFDFNTYSGKLKSELNTGSPVVGDIREFR